MSDKNDAREEARLRTILNSMVEAVFVTDPKGRVVMTNPALDALGAHDVIGRRAKHVLKSDVLRVAVRRARKKNEATEVELQTEVEGKVRTLHAQVSPLPRGAGVVTVLHDVTSLREVDRMRRDFVANASHELRTPLTAIRGYAETLRDGALDDPAAARRFVDGILRHAERLERLVQDLTLLSQTESSLARFDAAPHDVRALCRQSLASLEAFARAREVPLVLDLPSVSLPLNVSDRALEQVVINLVENAIKHSPPGAPVQVRARREGEHVLVEVTDQGCGIAPEHHARIFERFYRVDAGRSREEGGSGLGLSIVRNLVERMGGSIELRSQLDAGASFRVRLPVDTELEGDEP